jgi:hypothetical protein
MFNWKLIVTVIIILGIVAYFISTETSVQGFFKSMKDRLYAFIGYTATEERNISFSLTAEYGNISFKDDVNLTIQPVSFSAGMTYMNIETSDTVSMDFSGTGEISGRSLNLDGFIYKLEIANSSMTFKKASIESASSFEKLIIDKLELDKLELRDGSLVVKGTETRFSDQIEIYNLEGSFEFSDKLKIDGLAGRISIPEADIVID